MNKKFCCAILFISVISLMVFSNQTLDKLNQAIKDNDIKQVQKLLKRKINLNELDQAGYSPLYYAVMNNNIDIIKLLAAKGAYVNYKIIFDKYNKLEYSPLQQAVVSNKNFETIKTLVELGADVNVKINKYFLIFYSLFNNNFELLILLVENGADIISSYYDDGMHKYSLLEHFKNNIKFEQDIIKKKQLLEMVKIIINAFPDINTSDIIGSSPIHYAAAIDYELLKFTIEKGADLNVISKTEQTPLLITIARNYSELITDKKNDLESIKLLLEKGAEVNNLELVFAVANNRLDIVKLLLENSNDIDKLLNGSSNINFNWKPPLLFAIKNNNIEIVKFLIKKGANVNMTDGNKKSFLDYAIEYKFNQIVDILKKAGAKDYTTLLAMKNKSKKDKTQNNYDNHILGPFIKAFKNNDIIKMLEYVDSNIEFKNDPMSGEFKKLDGKNNPHILNKNEVKKLLGQTYFKEAANLPIKISDDYINKKYKYLLYINPDGAQAARFYFELINGKPSLKRIDIEIQL